MEITYICENKSCTHVDKEPFSMKLKMDAVMDEKNIADMFCPHCKRSLNKENKSEAGQL